ncbi:hypothetical protein [Hydrocarboniphaga sp.]|uniref:hypothetical protein n=1 Tax=Hydrocarboniphaga sp. TaxID=2033016 RepID=UPI003D0EE0E8
MSNCAGCSPMQYSQTDKCIPSCLERIVFPYSAYRASGRISLMPSYQCLACGTIWMHDDNRGYESQRRLQQAA